MKITYSHINRILPLAAVVFVIFLLWSSAASACGISIVCGERDGGGRIPAGESLTNGCLSGIGHVEQTDCPTGGSEGGGGGGGGGGGEVTPFVTLTATPASIEQGRSSQLEWSSVYTSSCSINQGVGSVTRSGTRSVAPSSTTTYVITCQTTIGTTVTDDAVVTVTPVPQPLAVSCAVAPDDTLVNETVTWEGFVNSGSGATSYSWKNVGGSTMTKVCSGGSNTLAFQNTCADGVYDGASCSASQVGTRCKVSQDQDSCVADGGTVYGSTQAFYCQATNVNAPTYTYSWSGTDGLAGLTKQVSKAYASTGTKSGTVRVSSTQGSATATCSAVVSAPPVVATPDLTPAGISPTTATAGNSTTVTATINNIGGAVANANQTYIRVAGSKGNLYADTTNVPAIQAGSSGTVTFNVTLPSEGSYPVEVCADQNGTVTESNEGNNCATYSISVASRPITSSVSCDVSSRNVNVGGSATYTTSTSGSANAPYSWSSPQGGGPFGNNATVERTFTSAGTYQMTVSASGASAAATCPVVNVSVCPGTRTATLTATPNRVAQNGTATLSWSATAINTSCTITGPGVNQRVNSSSCTVPDGSVGTPAITTQTTYTISCDNGAVTDTAIVNVIPQFEEF